MILNSIKNLTFSIVIITAMLISSCQDNNTYFSYDQEVAATNDYVIGQQMMVLIMNTYFKSIADSLLLATGKSHIDGASIFYTGGEFDTLLIRYPVWGNDDGYDHWRAGDISVSTNQGFFNTETIYKFKFDGFFYDKDTLLVDSLTLRYVGMNGQNDIFTVSSDTIWQIFSDTSGKNRFWMQQSFQRFKDVSSAYHTPLDSFQIYGGFNGLSRNKVHYATETMETVPFLNQFDCAFLKKGPASISFEGVPYGGAVYFSDSDTCANQYIAELDGNPFPNFIYTHDW